MRGFISIIVMLCTEDATFVHVPKEAERFVPPHGSFRHQTRALSATKRHWTHGPSGANKQVYMDRELLLTPPHPHTTASFKS